MSDTAEQPQSPPSPPPSSAPELIHPDGVQAVTDVDGAETGDGVVPGSDIQSPAKIIRIGAMVKQLLEEVRNTSLDDASREQLARIYASSIDELKSALSADLGDELDTLSFDFAGDEPPSEAELRLAQAQLVGWLEGLFHGIQAALVAQQMDARQQLEGMRGQLPERTGGVPTPGPGYI